MAKVIVEFDYDATQPDELTIKKGDIISDVKKPPGGWWEGSLNGIRGVFPDNFVKDYTPPPSEHKPKVAPPPVGGSKVNELRGKIGSEIKVGPPPKHAKPKQLAAVLFEYKPEQPDELMLMEGDTVEIVGMAEEGWWEGVLRGKRGMFPSNFVKLIDQQNGSPAPTSASSSVPSSNSYSGRPNDVHPSGRPPLDKIPQKMPDDSMSRPPPDSGDPPVLPTRNRGTRAKVIYSYHAQNNDELTLDEGQVVKVLDMKLEDPGWWKGEMHGKIGVFPDNFVELISENEVPSQPPSLPGAKPPPPKGRIVRPRPPPQLPPEPIENPPPRPPGLHGPTPVDPRRGATPPPPTKPENKPPATALKPPAPAPAPAPAAVPIPDVAAAKVDTKAVAALKAELEDLRASTVSKEAYEQLRRELNDAKKALDVFKTDTLEKFRSLMREIDNEKKTAQQNQVELTRIRELADDQWMLKRST